MKLRDIIKIYEALSGLSAEDQTKRFSFAGAVRFRIAANLVELHKHYELFDKQRIELVKQYGDPTPENSDQFRVTDPEKLKAFNEQIQSMLDAEVKIELEPLSKKDMLGKGSENEISLGLLTILLETGAITAK